MDKRIREGFPNQRLVVLPTNVIQRCRNLPMVSYLHITDLGCYPSVPHHYVERKTGIPQAILMYCLAGKGILNMDKTIHSVQQGQVVVIPPRTPHIYQADADDPWSVFWIQTSLIWGDWGILSRKFNSLLFA